MLSFGGKFCVLYFIFCSKYFIFDEDLSYLNIFFSSFIVSKLIYLSPWKEIVDCWKESTAGKTHVKQPHFYPIIGYQIQNLSIQQHNVLAFLKKFLIKTFLTWTHESAFFYLSICPSLFYMRGSIVGNLSLYHTGDLFYCIHHWRILCSSYRRLALLGWFIFFSFIEQQ